MSKRRNFKAIVTDNTGNTIIGEKETFAWNSAIKATETIVREHARAGFTLYSGDKPVVMEAGVAGNHERIYRRNWTSGTGIVINALVWEVI